MGRGRKRKRLSKKTGAQDDVEDWDTYMDMKKSKLMQQFNSDLAQCNEKLSDIFKGVAIFVNGLTKPNAEELKVLMTKHGGVFHTYQMSTTTHIIASNLAYAKMKHLGSIPIVKPQWITESIDMEKLLDFRRYLLYTNQSTTQPRLQFPVIPKPSSKTMKEKTETLNKNIESSLEVGKEKTDTSCVISEDIKSKDTKNKCENLKHDDESSHSMLPNHSKASTSVYKNEENSIVNGILENNEDTYKESSDTSDKALQTDDKQVFDTPDDILAENVFDISESNIDILDNKEKKVDEKVFEQDKASDSKLTSPLSPDIFADETPPDQNDSTDQKQKEADSNSGNNINNNNINNNNINNNNKVSETTKNVTNDITVNERKSHLGKTAADPTFLKEFYNHSRLHLISTLCAEFKQLVSELREKSDGKFPGRQKLIEVNASRPDKTYTPGPVIMHIDMDCFFVSVGLRTRPHLKNKPVAVTHGQGNVVRPSVGREAELELRMEHSNPEAAEKFSALDVNSSMSEVASCSYEARKYGIKNGMFLGTALRLCPELQTIPYDFQGYRQVSTTLYNTVASYTLDIEAVSCDEMYVDVTKILHETGLSVEEWATHIRNEIMEKTGCPCSAGFGANRLQARLATKKAKPAGQFYLRADDIESYMQDIPLADIPGVGYATLAKLKNLGLTTCGDIQLSSLNMLKAELGQKNGEILYQQARGIDSKPLNFSHQRKTVSTEVNYGIRFKTIEETYNFLKNLSHEVYDRLKTTNMKAKTVTLKLLVRSPEAPVQTAKYLGHGICNSFTKSSAVNTFLTSGDIVFREIKKLYDHMNPPFEDLRGIGIHLTKLEKDRGQKKTLFNFCKKATDTTTEKPVKTDVPINDVKANIDVMSSVQGTVIKDVRKEKTNEDICSTSRKDTAEFNTRRNKLTIQECKPSTFRQSRDIPPAIPSTSFASDNAKFKEDRRQNNLIIQESKPSMSRQTGDVPPAIPSTSFAPDNIRFKGDRKQNELTIQESKPSASHQTRDIPSAIPSTSFAPDDVKFIEQASKSSAKNKKIPLIRASRFDGMPSTSYAASIDLEVLKELPEEIQREIAKEYKIDELLKETSAVEKRDDKEVREKDNRKWEDEYRVSEETVPKSPFHNIGWEELKSVIRNWMNNEKEPNNVDTDMLGTYCRELAELRKIEYLKMLTSFLYRVLSTKNCRWHNAYFEIINSTQQGMVARYGSTLLVNRAYKCCRMY